MKRYLPQIYAWALILLFLGGQIFAFASPFLKSLDLYALLTVCGFALSAILSPTIHELGHIAFAKSADMFLIYTKFSFFSFRRIEGKLRFSLASPFAAEQTEVAPLKSGNMKKRMLKFASGGLVFGGLWLVLLGGLLAAFYFFFQAGFYFTLGVIPYAAYLFFLNLPPVSYQSGKADTLIYKGIKKGEDVEKCMLSVMEIYGQLAEGKTFDEVDKSLYFDLPIIPEDEQSFAALQLLRYRYFVDDGDFDGAADSLNRLVCAGEYLDETAARTAFYELVFMHSLNGDLELAKDCFSQCADSFEENAPLRAQIAYAALLGEDDKVLTLFKKAETCFISDFLGEDRSERRLLEKLRASLVANGYNSL